MSQFFNQYHRFVDKIERQYHAPNSVEFRNREFDKINWSKPEYRNFFTIIKTLAEKGPSTIKEIVEHDGLSKEFKNNCSRYITYRRIIQGDKNLQVIGLIEKGVIVASKAEDKLHKKYELSHNGILYAIKLFMDTEIVSSGNYKGILKMDSKVRWYDYSTQVKFPTTIIDIIAKNYSHVLPLIFGRWEYLKRNPRINVYNLYDLTITRYNSRNMMNELISCNSKYSIKFTTYDGDIALEFYTRQIEQAYYPIEYFLEAIKNDIEIIDFIEKIFYSYERMHKENFYKSQAHCFLFKGKKEKALKNMVKAVELNDLLDSKHKEEFKKTTVDQIDYHGIQFCR